MKGGKNVKNKLKREGKIEVKSELMGYYTTTLSRISKQNNVDVQPTKRCTGMRVRAQGAQTNKQNDKSVLVPVLTAASI
jgi:hypothetical protein